LQRGYTAEEVCAEVGITRRQLNRWTSTGAVARPLGRGRGAYYLGAHIRQCRAVKAILSGDHAPRRLEDMREARLYGNELFR
jgi:hypothetical protein